MINVNKIAVIGSSNTDMVIQTLNFPKPGETILGNNFFMNPGGKGANQAVSAARLNGNVLFICKLGKDIFGEKTAKLLNQEGIDTALILYDDNNPSGVALITVDGNAENCISVALGANANLKPEDILMAEKAFEKVEFILLQLEIPIETIEYIVKEAVRMNKKVILNPAPVQFLSKQILENLFLITPNETEAEMISGVKIIDQNSAEIAAKKISDLGVTNVIITLGSKGALVYSENEFEMVPAVKVKAIDTTAAGDVFNGALVVALAEGKTIIDAVRFGCKASSISVTKLGAQSSAPYRDEVDSLI